MRHRPVRYPCSYPTELCLAGSDTAVVVVNVSAQGVRVRGIGHLDIRIHPGAVVTIRLAGSPRAAELRWLRGDDAGLRLVQPLGAREVALVRQATLARASGVGWNTHLRELGR